MSNKKKKQCKKDIKSGERSKLLNAAVETCYKPDCSRPLFVSMDGHWINNFDIAHIRDELEPASRDSDIGYRYYPAPTNDKEHAARNQYDNLILLYRTCHNLIDKIAPRDYSVRLLHDWKRQAESNELRTRLLSTFGSKALTEQDWTDALLDGSAIATVHAASEQAWESLDNRMSVKSSYINGKQVMAIGAKDEPVPLVWKFGGEHGQKMQGLIRNAQPFSIPSKELTITGSDLFSKLLEQSGVMLMLPQRKPAIVKLSLLAVDGSAKFQFDEITGNITIGTEILVFEGSCFDGLFSLRLEVPLSGKGESGNFSFNFDLSKWDGVDIQSLPYFGKLEVLLDAMEERGNLSGVIEYRGDELFKFGTSLKGFNVVDWGAYQYVLFAGAAKKIAQHFDEPVAFDENFYFSEEEHDTVHELVKFIRFVEEPALLKKQFTATTTHIATEGLFKPDTLENRAITGEPLDIVNVEPAVDIQVFDRTLPIPKRANVLGAVAPLIVGDKPKQAGDKYRVEWRKTDRTKTHCFFEDEAHPIPIGA